jgi:prepilin signal peptidase PulO-like enzyme (type II secretory pathway)
LGGRCRQCQVKISWQYPLVELATAVLLVLTWQHDLASPQLFWLLWRDWLVIITLLIVFVYDFRWQLVPVSALWWLGGLVALINLVLGYSPISLLLYAVVGGGFFLLQYLLTNKRGVGEGDIWLGVFLGLVFPSAGESFLALLIAYIIGAVVGLSLVWSKHKDFQSRIALGPFLAIGAIITLIWGQMIIDWYLSLF